MLARDTSAESPPAAHFPPIPDTVLRIMSDAARVARCAEDLPNQALRQVAPGQLEPEGPGMSHETPAGLEEPMLQARQGPALDGDGQGDPLQAIAQVVGRAGGGHAALGVQQTRISSGAPEPVSG